MAEERKFKRPIENNNKLMYLKSMHIQNFRGILQEELIAAKVLPSDYDFEAHKKLVAMQPGDVPVTFADTTPLEEDFGFRPSTPLRDGLSAFAQWYAKYYETCE